MPNQHLTLKDIERATKWDQVYILPLLFLKARTKNIFLYRVQKFRAGLFKKNMTAKAAIQKSRITLADHPAKPRRGVHNVLIKLRR
jgi:hypothetical protein